MALEQVGYNHVEQPVEQLEARFNEITDLLKIPRSKEYQDRLSRELGCIAVDVYCRVKDKEIEAVFCDDKLALYEVLPDEVEEIDYEMIDSFYGIVGILESPEE